MNPAMIELTAPDISCAKCNDNIEGDLASEPGIEQLSVDVSARRIRIAHDPQRTSPSSCGPRCRRSDIPPVPDGPAIPRPPGQGTR